MSRIYVSHSPAPAPGPSQSGLPVPDSILAQCRRTHLDDTKGLFGIHFISRRKNWRGQAVHLHSARTRIRPMPVPPLEIGKMGT